MHCDFQRMVPVCLSVCLCLFGLVFRVLQVNGINNHHCFVFMRFECVYVCMCVRSSPTDGPLTLFCFSASRSCCSSLPEWIVRISLTHTPIHIHWVFIIVYFSVCSYSSSLLPSVFLVFLSFFLFSVVGLSSRRSSFIVIDANCSKSNSLSEHNTTQHDHHSATELFPFF